MSRFTKLGGQLSGFGYIPPGGRKGQFLVKTSAADCLAEWKGDHFASAEDSTGVDPVDESADVGSYLRYGLDPNGDTNSTSALLDMLHVGNEGVPLDFGTNTTFLVDPFVISEAEETLFPYAFGANVTFKANSTGVLCTIKNPHSQYPGFQWNGFHRFDSNGLATSAMLIQGSQHAYYGPMQFVRSTGPQCRVEGQAGAGVYYNSFIHWRAGGSTSEGGGDVGFFIQTVDEGVDYQVADNGWWMPRSLRNASYAYDIDRCSDTFVVPHAERNGIAAFKTNRNTGLTFLGGYSENNGIPDTSFVLTELSDRTFAFGGRHVGITTGHDLGGNGNVLLPGTGNEVNISPDWIGVPSLTTTQRDAIATPFNRIIIYNQTTGKFQGYAGGTWVDFH